MKKIICVGLIIVSLFATLTSVSAMSEFQKLELMKFGIMVGDGNGNLRLNDNITRAEAAKIICCAGKLRRAEGEITPFPDVPSIFWGYEYIMIAKSHGIVVGDQNGNFNPNTSVTNEEFIKMIVSLLKYDPWAEARGGYPAGYIATASIFGITEGLNELGINVPATRNDVGIMIHNSLDIHLLEWTTVDGVDAEAKKSEKTLRDNFS